MTILGLLKMPKILTRLGNRLTILLSCSLIFLSLILLAFGNNASVVIPAYYLFYIN